MITYLVCLVIGLLGVGIIFGGRPDNEFRITFGAALYFIALFAAAIHSLHAS